MQTPLTLNEAKNLKYGEHIYHMTKTNTTGKIRVKINGAPKIWKRTPSRVQIPVKYGLYEYFYITESELNEWSKTED